MKKLVASFFCFFAFCIIVNAKTVYVASSGNNTTGDSWTNALTSIPNSGSSAIAAGDSVFVKNGTYSFSASTANGSAFATKADVNYLGGFAGTESNSSQRLKSDIDNNGIIESWEFSNATTLSFNSTNNAYGLYINSNTAKRVFDGFIITGTLNVGQLSGSTGGNNMVRVINYSTFRNNILRNCTLSAAPNTATANMGYTKGALLYVGQGSTTTVNNVVDNCLIEKNTSTITPTSSQTQDVQQSPLVHIDASNTTGRNVLSNCVFRKNQITLDYTNFGMTSPAYNNPRGMLVSMSIFGSSSLIGQYNSIKNILVYNNTAAFTPKGGSGTTNLGNGGLIFTYNTAQATYDSIVNCTVVNNSMMRIGYAIRGNFTNTTQPYHVIANNVLLNNKNDNGSGTISVQNLALNQNPAGAAGTITIVNNVGNGGISATANANNVFGNVTDLSTTNINAKGAYFSSPNSINGYSTDTLVATSRWTVDAGSYLTSKGYALPLKTDKGGLVYAATPTVGAYETKTTPVITWSQDFSSTAKWDTYNLSANSTNAGINSSAITYSSADPSTAQITGSSMTLLKLGTTTITASQAASCYYNAAVSVDKSVTVDLLTGVDKVAMLKPCYVNNKSVVSNLDGVIEISSVDGKRILLQKVSNGDRINLKSGVYILRFVGLKGTEIQKIAL